MERIETREQVWQPGVGEIPEDAGPSPTIDSKLRRRSVEVVGWKPVGELGSRQAQTGLRLSEEHPTWRYRMSRRPAGIQTERSGRIMVQREIINRRRLLMCCECPPIAYHMVHCMYVLTPTGRGVLMESQ